MPFNIRLDVAQTLLCHSRCEEDTIAANETASPHHQKFIQLQAHTMHVFLLLCLFGAARAHLQGSLVEAQEVQLAEPRDRALAQSCRNNGGCKNGSTCKLMVSGTISVVLVFKLSRMEALVLQMHKTETAKVLRVSTRMAIGI
eukprot:15907-Heterococcus_DN1.PRE.2